MKKQIAYFCITMVALILFVSACKKPAGPGGRATIKGKVYARDFDNTQNYLMSSGYSSGTKVYIVYGNNTVVGGKAVTDENGNYEFMYLHKGKYKVFVNSLDTSFKVKGNKTEIPVVKEVEIKEPRQVITLEDLVINK